MPEDSLIPDSAVKKTRPVNAQENLVNIFTLGCLTTFCHLAATTPLQLPPLANCQSLSAANPVPNIPIYSTNAVPKCAASLYCDTLGTALGSSIRESSSP